MERYARNFFSALGIVALLAAGCGDDDNDGDNNGGTNVPPPTPSGTVTAVSRGAITAIEDSPARITVNGVAVPTTNATIRVEDVTGQANQLAPGMVVTVKRHDNGGFEIEYEDAVKGTVDSASVTPTGFTVAGVPI